MTTTRIKRFSVADRLFHVFLMLTFMMQALTGFSRLYAGTLWGHAMINLLGGYDTCLAVHAWVGILMTLGFLVQSIMLLIKVDLRNLTASIFGPDSLVPNLQDFKNFIQQIRWFFGAGPPAKFDRWTYFEKFDFWAVYWGMPLLAITGLMLMYPVAASRFVPGWFLNIALLFHRAEAVLAVTYIFIVHFFIGHLRPTSFPLNEAMFAGSIPVEEAQEEKPLWVQRINASDAEAKKPASWYRIAYYLFGYAMLATGIYLLVNGIRYSGSVHLH